jgi:hypothetical protein
MGPGNFLKNMKRNLKRRMKLRPSGMSSSGVPKKFKMKGFGGLKFGQNKGF